MTKKKGEDPIDQWSYVHSIGSLIIGFFIPNYFLIYLILSIIFEIFETRIGTIIYDNIEKKYSKALKEYESVPNKIADIVANMVGYLAGSFISNILGNPITLL